MRVVPNNGYTFRNNIPLAEFNAMIAARRRPGTIVKVEERDGPRTSSKPGKIALLSGPEEIMKPIAGVLYTDETAIVLKMKLATGGKLANWFKIATSRGAIGWVSGWDIETVKP